jgi:branched-chain amino acid transport system permease protein
MNVDDGRLWVASIAGGVRALPSTLASRGRSAPRRTTALLVGIALLVLYPWLTSAVIRPLAEAGIPLPLPDNTAATFMLVYGILALGLNIVVGFAGLLDLGYVAFFAIGSYVAAFLASPHWYQLTVSIGGSAPPGLIGIHVNFFLLIGVAALVAAGAGALIGTPTLRLRGDYLAIVTLAFGEIVPVAFRNLSNVSFNIGPFHVENLNITGGPLGITPIDPAELFGVKFNSASGGAAYWLGLVLVIALVAYCRNLEHSRLGRAWAVIREDERAARMMGINTVRTKLMAFAMGAAIGGIGGLFQASYLGSTSSDFFAYGTSCLVLAMVIVGGIGNVWGVVAGGALLEWVNLTFLTWSGDRMHDLGQTLGIPLLTNLVPANYSFLLFGLLLLLMMLLRPEGLLPNQQRASELRGARGPRKLP